MSDSEQAKFKTEVTGEKHIHVPETVTFETKDRGRIEAVYKGIDGYELSYISPHEVIFWTRMMSNEEFAHVNLFAEAFFEGLFLGTSYREDALRDKKYGEKRARKKLIAELNEFGS